MDHLVPTVNVVCVSEQVWAPSLLLSPNASRLSSPSSDCHFLLIYVDASVSSLRPSPVVSRYLFFLHPLPLQYIPGTNVFNDQMLEVELHSRSEPVTYRTFYQSRDTRPDEGRIAVNKIDV